MGKLRSDPIFGEMSPFRRAAVLVSSPCSLFAALLGACSCGLSAANPELITYSADFAVHKLDRDHILGRTDEAKGGVGASVEISVPSLLFLLGAI